MYGIKFVESLEGYKPFKGIVGQISIYQPCVRWGFYPSNISFRFLHCVKENFPKEIIYSNLFIFGFIPDAHQRILCTIPSGFTSNVFCPYFLIHYDVTNAIHDLPVGYPLFSDLSYDYVGQRLYKENSYP